MRLRTRFIASLRLRICKKRADGFILRRINQLTPTCGRALSVRRGQLSISEAGEVSFVADAINRVPADAYLQGAAG